MRKHTELLTTLTWLGLGGVLLCAAGASSAGVFTGPAVFERLSHFKDVGVPATLHDTLNRRMIADATCRTLGGSYDGFAFFHDGVVSDSVTRGLSNLPTTAAPSNFTLTAQEKLPALCKSASASNLTNYQCGVLPFPGIAASMDAWHRALCATKNDPAWNGKFDPAYQPQQIALTAGFMCILTCDCARMGLPGTQLSNFASSVSQAQGVADQLCSDLPFHKVNFTASASNPEEFAGIASPLRGLCGCTQ